jgi:hypothetical protein
MVGLSDEKEDVSFGLLAVSISRQSTESLPAALRIKQEIFDSTISLTQPGPLGRLAVNYDHDYKYEEEHFPSQGTMAYAIRAHVTTYLINNQESLVMYRNAILAYQTEFRARNNDCLPHGLLMHEAKDYLHFACPSMMLRVRRLLHSFQQLLQHHAFAKDSFMSPDSLDSALNLIFDLPPPPEDLIHQILTEFPLPKGNGNYPFNIDWARKQAGRLATRGSYASNQVLTTKTTADFFEGDNDYDDGELYLGDVGGSAEPLTRSTHSHNHPRETGGVPPLDAIEYPNGSHIAPSSPRLPSPCDSYHDSDDEGPQKIVLSPAKRSLNTKRPRPAFKSTKRMLNRPKVAPHGKVWSSLEDAISLAEGGSGNVGLVIVIDWLDKY